MANVDLYAYLGVDQGQLRLYVSTQQLNVIGTRLEKGAKFPHAVYDFVDDPREDNSARALAALQDFFDGKDSRSTMTFGEKLTKRKRK